MYKPHCYNKNVYLLCLKRALRILGTIFSFNGKSFAVLHLIRLVMKEVYNSFPKIINLHLSAQTANMFEDERGRGKVSFIQFLI